LDVLTRAALIHYQFETIHPFLDGNGRIGRLLVILFLMSTGVIATPLLYISYFLRRNRIEYYERLTCVRVKGDYEQWVYFFLQAVKESAESAIEAIDELSALHMKNEELVVGKRRSSKTLKSVFAYLERHPIIEIKKTAAVLGISFNATESAINHLLEAGILVRTKNVRSNRTFSYKAYLDILRDGT
jgi:Fic family protein